MTSTIHRIGRSIMACYPFPRGQGRIVDRTFLSRLHFEEPTLLVSTTDGFRLRVNPNDHIGRHLYLTGQFDRTIVEVLLAHCRPDARILDIGANIGYVSGALLHLLPDCRVAAVEPNPASFALLQENISQIGGVRATAIRAAVSDEAGTGLLEVGETNSGASHLVSGEGGGDGGEAPGRTVEVELVTGKALMARSGLDRLDAVKIDVEGHETAVLRTLAPVLRVHRPRAVVFEHHGRLRAGSPLVEEIFAPLGYRVHGLVKSLTRWRLEPVDGDGQGRWSARDYVALSESGTA